jgi:hypothetical protein
VAAKNFDEWFDSINVSMSQSRKHILFLAWEAATDALEDNFKSHNKPSAKCQCGAEAVYHYCRICWCMEIDSQKLPDTSHVGLL